MSVSVPQYYPYVPEPCPFCGAVQFEPNTDLEDYSIVRSGTTVAYQCCVCAAQGPVVHVSPDEPEHWQIKRAIEAWSTPLNEAM